MSTPVDETRVLILSGDPDVYLEPLQDQFPALSVRSCRSYDRLPDVLHEYQPTVVLASKMGREPFPRETLLEDSSVQWIQATSAGVDHLLPLSRRVQLTSARGVHDEVLADYILCSVLMFNLHFPTFARQQVERVWRPQALEPAAGQCLVVLGLGSIGHLVAAKAKRLGMRAVGVRARPDAAMPRPGLDAPDAVLGVDRLKDAVGEADHLAVTLPLTPRTRGLVSSEILRAMKQGSVLINVSRGGIVDEQALVAALREGPLSGAAIDVFEKEPLPPDSELWDLSNVVITPHTGDIRGAQQKVAELFCRNLKRWRSGEPLLNLVDPERAY